MDPSTRVGGAVVQVEGGERERGGDKLQKMTCSSKGISNFPSTMTNLLLARKSFSVNQYFQPHQTPKNEEKNFRQTFYIKTNAA